MNLDDQQLVKYMKSIRNSNAGFLLVSMPKRIGFWDMRQVVFKSTEVRWANTLSEMFRLASEVLNEE